MAVDVWVFGLLLILLIALFFYLGLRIIGAVLRGIGTLLRWGISPWSARRAGGVRRGPLRTVAWRTAARICPNPHCRRANVTVARFCAQCGQRLES